MQDLSQYPFNIRRLSKDEGGGFLISFPDFSDCISDGETPEEAIHNGMDALRETIAALEEFGFPVPDPNKTDQHKQYQLLLPQKLYTELSHHAKLERRNLKDLAILMISEALHNNKAHQVSA